jgi:MoaA/NifB/PqqE/SkfB family radical SAM enzyme
MSIYKSIEPQYNQINSFQITWELTLKCNLDCSYCGVNDHNNAIPHPNLTDCFKTVDFLLEYVDLYMSQRIPSQRFVGLNVFGGESLFHPNIVEILEYIKMKHEPYKDKWDLSIQTVTNAVVKEKIWNKIINLIDFFTISYHSESKEEQQDLVRNNILELMKKNKNFHCAVLMHTKHWDNCINMIEWCKLNNVPYLPRQLDHQWHNFKFYYTKEQVQWWDDLRGITTKIPIHKKIMSIVNMDSKGRSCCGGNQMHVNCNYESTQTYIPNNNFKGWHCSVNRFFVFVKQISGEIFTNKDCKMGFNEKVEPIGYLNDSENLLLKLRKDISDNTLPIVICQKSQCKCGLCAPKASSRIEYDKIMIKHMLP